jgi:hypothetical protein
MFKSSLVQTFGNLKYAIAQIATVSFILLPVDVNLCSCTHS